MTKKTFERKMANLIFSKGAGKQSTENIFNIISKAAAAKLMEWRYGMADPSPLMATLYSNIGKTDVWLRRTEDLSEEKIHYSLTFKTPVKGKHKNREKTFYYPVDLAEKSTSRFHYKDRLVIGWFLCESNARRNERGPR